MFIVVLIATLGRIGVQTASVVAVMGAAGRGVGVYELAYPGSKFVVHTWCETEDYWSVYFYSTLAVKEVFNAA